MLTVARAPIKHALKTIEALVFCLCPVEWKPTDGKPST